VILASCSGLMRRRRSLSSRLTAAKCATASANWMSEGSEYPAVVIPLVTQHYTMLARNLLYTGVTRGKQPVVLVGQRKGLAIAVRGQGSRRRWSKLCDYLTGVQGQQSLPRQKG
jgi:exodeoxyribonuclease V alpha subunit